MKHSWRCVAVLLLAGGLLAAPLFAVAPGNKRQKTPGASNNGNNARGRGDRYAQIRVQTAPLDTRVSARKLQLEILNSHRAFPGLRQQIATARTDEIKRAAWNQFYTILYGEMRRRNPGLTEYIGLLEEVARSRYDSPRRRGEALDSAGFDRAEL
jgi:hypothetical protein